MDYTAPTVTELGSLRELTLAGPSNKVGTSSDIYSNVVPLVGSIVDAR